MFNIQIDGASIQPMHSFSRHRRQERYRFCNSEVVDCRRRRVAITGRDRAKLDEAVSELSVNVLAIQTDLDDLATIDSVMKQVSDAYGSLDIVFANAGISGLTPLGRHHRCCFEAILRTNLTAVFSRFRQRCR